MHISIEDLDDGVHDINLDGDPDSLDLPRENVSFSTPVKVEGRLTVSENNVIVQVRMATDADFECCRCLKPIKEHISGDIAVLYERTDRVIPETEDLTAADDIEVLDFHTKAIDLSHRIEEVIQLSIPLNPICFEDCKGLCSICGINLNEKTCDCKLEKDDPRWHVLKALLKEE